MPYAPGIQSVPFHADMSGWGNALLKFMGDQQARADKIKEDAKSHRTYMAMGQQLGLDPGELKNAGLEGAKGMVEGYIAKSKFEELAQTVAAKRAEMQNAQRDAGHVAQFQRSYSNMTTPMQIPAGTFGPLSQTETIGGPMSGEDKFNLMQQSGVSPDDQYKLLRAYGEIKGNQPMQLPEGARVTGGTMGPGGLSTTYTLPSPRQNEQPTRIILNDGTPTGKASYSDGTIIDLPDVKTKALTDSQANALQFSERMGYNNNIITELERQGFNPAGTAAAAAQFTPNVMTPKQFQSYDAARKNWISAVLRKESGASISDKEKSSAIAEYFPAWGDDPQAVLEKAGRRALAEKNMRIAVGAGEASTASADKTIPRFDSEEAARSAGVGTNVFMMYDPQSATYRRARLK